MNSITRHRGGFSSINDSIMDFSKRLAFLSTYRRHQTWSLPDSIIYYISKNPLTPKAYQKMIQACKYFFIENPILSVPCFSVFFQCAKWHTSFERYNYRVRVSDRKPLDLRNIKSKIWVTEAFDANPYLLDGHHPHQNFLSSSGIIPRIYQCDIQTLNLWYQNISFNDFKFLSSNASQIHLTQINVVNDDGSTVALEKIVEALSNVKIFSYDHCLNLFPNIITSKTASELIKIPHFSNLDCFCLNNLQELFDIDTFYNYVKCNKKTKFSLGFVNQISEAYKIRLQKIDAEIPKTKIPHYMRPSVFFFGMDSIFC